MGVIVRQKVKGRGKPWGVFVSHNGKRTSRKVGDKKAAEDVASEIRTKIKLGEFGFEEQKPVPTFKEYADSWLEFTIKPTWKASTHRGYQDILNNHVLPMFGDFKLTEIKRGAIKDFLLSKISDGLARSTVSHMKDAISGVFNKALDDEVVESNPALQLKKVLPKGDITESVDPLDADELKLLLDTIQEYYSEHYVLFLLLVRTGMRIGEALALQRGDVDFNKRFIWVRKTYYQGKIKPTKNSRQRKVDISFQLTEALKTHRVLRKRKGLALGMGDKPEFVFTNKTGNPIDVDNWRQRIFNKSLEKAENRKIRIHDLRHTYASLRISKGDNIADVSK